jgi:hypothetical protein
MKTIIWKELRENTKWAAAIFLCLALAEIYSLYEYRHSFPAFGGGLTLCNSTFLLMSALGCAMAGAALGSLQILPELSRDHWATVLHRPIPRRTLFFGKVAAGLLLYLSATLAPLLLSMLYVALPGVFGVPFIPRMAIPAATDLLLGVVTYFAALLISLGHGPWFGKRGLQVLSVLPCVALQLTEGWIAPLLLASLVYVLAAYGAMLGHGNDDHSAPRLARAGSVLVLTTGAEVALLLVIALVFCFPWAKEKPAADAVLRSFVVANESGTVFVSTYRPSTFERKLTDFQGRPVTDERYLGSGGRNPFCYLAPLTQGVRKPGGQPDRLASSSRRPGDNYIDLVEGFDSEDTEAWYLDVQGNYFIGYDKGSHQRIGICDRHGFQGAAATPQPFPFRLKITSFEGSPHLAQSGSQLFLLKFRAREMSLVFDAGADPLYAATWMGPLTLRGPFYIAVALQNDIKVLDLNGATLTTTAYTHDVSGLAELSIATTAAGDRIFVQYATKTTSPKVGEAPVPSFLEEIDFSGKVVHSYSGEVVDTIPRQPGWLRSVAQGVLPIVPVALQTLYVRWAGHTSPADAPTDDFRSSPKLLPLSLGASLAGLALPAVIAGLAALGVLLWSTRLGVSESQRLAWSLFVLCLGLPGLIAFRLTAGWPTRVLCPACRHQRPLETDNCPSCHEAWPAPSTDGTEILADRV